MGIPEKLYSQLYGLRNDFAHGNPVRAKSLVPLGSKNFSFIQIAPVLFRAALMQRSMEIKKRKPRPTKSTSAKWFSMHFTFGDDTVNAIQKVAGLDS